MSAGVRQVLATVAIIVAGAFVFMSFDRILERQQTENQINVLREEINRSRITTDRCRGVLETSQASLLQLRATIDSLRQAIDSYERLPSQGTPVVSYDDYTSVLEEHNDSVGIWERRQERLRTTEHACRAKITAHNVLAESLKDALTEAGIITDSP